jgi:hypothetical protein
MEDNIFNYLVVKIPKENTANLMYFLRQFKDAKIVGMMCEIRPLTDKPIKDVATRPSNRR